MYMHMLMHMLMYMNQRVERREMTEGTEKEGEQKVKMEGHHERLAFEIYSRQTMRPYYVCVCVCVCV